MITLDFLLENATQTAWTFNDDVVLHDLDGVIYSTQGSRVFAGSNFFEKHSLAWNENYQFTKSDIESFKASLVH